MDGFQAHRVGPHVRFHSHHRAHPPSRFATHTRLTRSASRFREECGKENLAFLECKDVTPNPEKCLAQGYDVTKCVSKL